MSNSVVGRAPARIIAFVRHEPVLSILVAALIALQAVHSLSAIALVRLVDWQTVATLAGLLMLTKALELSGFLMWLAHRIVHRVRSERALAALLVVFAAALSVWLTNDVALFVVIPLVLSLRELTPLPFKRLVIYIALAVNAGAIATPLGNPQNLFLWQLSGVSFGRFVIALGPLAGGAAGAACGARGGVVATRRAGTAFAMLTLGIGELVAAAAWRVPHWFGGAGGVSIDRAAGPAPRSLRYATFDATRISELSIQSAAARLYASICADRAWAASAASLAHRSMKMKRRGSCKSRCRSYCSAPSSLRVGPTIPSSCSNSFASAPGLATMSATTATSDMRILLCLRDKRVSIRESP